MSETNYTRLFGTPERAMRVVYALEACRVVDCPDCVARGVCRIYSGFAFTQDDMLEWLEDEAI